MNEHTQVKGWLKLARSRRGGHQREQLRFSWVFMGSKQPTLQLSSPVSDLWSTLFGRLFLSHVKHWFKEYPKQAMTPHTRFDSTASFFDSSGYYFAFLKQNSMHQVKGSTLDIRCTPKRVSA